MGTHSTPLVTRTQCTPLLYRKGRETPKKGALPSLSTKVAFSTYSYPRSSAYKKGDGAHVDTERCPTYLALPLSTPPFDLMGEGLQPLTGGCSGQKFHSKPTRSHSQSLLNKPD